MQNTVANLLVHVFESLSRRVEGEAHVLIGMGRCCDRVEYWGGTYVHPVLEKCPREFFEFGLINVGAELTIIAYGRSLREKDLHLKMYSHSGYLPPR